MTDSKNGIVVYEDGSKYWYRDGRLHREDGPAVEFPNGHQGWYLYGMRLGSGADGFWEMWDRLTNEQRVNPNLLRWMPC